MTNLKKILFFFLPIIGLVFLLFYFSLKTNNSLFSYSQNKQNDKTGQILQIPISVNDPIIGDKKNSDTLIVFADFACSACKNDSLILENLLTNYPNKFKIIWKGLPIAVYPYDSTLAIEYAYCANEQKKFPEFEKYSYTNNSDLSSSTLSQIITEINLDQKKFNKCLNEENKDNYIKINEYYAEMLNIQEIPTYFFNNKQITPKDENDWKLILNL
ncbi:MAG: thioredoxin domain-containing protein [Patescibacteria group bacterium]